MRSDILLRTVIIFVMCVMLDMILKKVNVDQVVKNKELRTSAIIALAPLVATYVPLLGMNRLMNTGMQPIISTMILFTVSYVLQQVMRERLEENEEKDDLKLAKVDRPYLIILTSTLLVELLTQMMSASKKKSNQIDIVVAGVDKYFKKQQRKMN